MSLDALLLFASTEFLLCLTPGPAVFFVVGLAMRRGVRVGIAASAGVTVGTAFYFALSALGIGTLIIASHTLFVALKWAGAAYLVYLGLKMMLPLLRTIRRSPAAARAAGDAPTSAGLEAAAGQPVRLGGAFWSAFAVQLANPKMLIFFLALFPQFLSPEGSVALQFLVMGVVSAMIELPVLIAYTVLSAGSVRFVRERVVLWLEATAGGMLMALGAALAVSRRI